MASLGSFRAQPLGTVLTGLVPVQIREYRPGINFSVCGLMLICSLLLGGGTRGGFLSDVILQLIAIPALLISVLSLIDSPIWRTQTSKDIYRVLGFCCVVALIPLIYLVPLPPWIWDNVLRREELAKIFDLLGNKTPWMPISVSPRATWLSLLSLLPPMAIFILAIQLSYKERRGLSLIIVAVGVVSTFVGLTQVAEGPSSLLRFFTITNKTEAVGFFANRNHFAALLYAVLIFAAVWAIDVSSKIGSLRDLKSFETVTIVALTAIFIIFIVVIAGEAMARSRAGLALTMIALLAVFALAFMDGRNASRVKATKLLLGAIFLAFILSMQFALYRILERFATDPLEDARIIFAHKTIAAAKAFMPFGSGSGTFVPVYQMFEGPSDAIANTYANHAHNDILELWLETGVLGPILLCLFVIWLGFTSMQLWRPPPAEMSAFDCTLGRAATVIIVLLLAHSFVDYPMRTEAIMAVFTACCAFLIKPVTGAEAGVKFTASLERYLAQRKGPLKTRRTVLVSRPASDSSATPTRGWETVPPRYQTGRRWGTDIEWPKEWQNPDGQSEASPTALTPDEDPEH